MLTLVFSESKDALDSFLFCGRQINSVDEKGDDNDDDDEDLQLSGREGGHTQVPEVEIVTNFLLYMFGYLRITMRGR